MFINYYLMPWSANWHSSCFIWACEELTLNLFKIFFLLVCLFHFKICRHHISVISTIIIFISTVILLTWASCSSTFRWPNLAVQKSVRQEFNLIGEFWNLVFKSMIWITATCLMVAVVTMDCKCKSEFISNYQLLFANSHFNSWHLDQFILFAKFTITPHSCSPCSSSHPQFECNSRTCCLTQSTKVVGAPNSHLWLSGRSDSGALRQITFWSLIRDDDHSLVLFF